MAIETTPVTTPITASPAPTATTAPVKKEETTGTVAIAPKTSPAPQLAKKLDVIA